MDHYIDIRIKPNADMRSNFILNKVYTQLHEILWDLKTDDLGVSFPEWKVLLGQVVRLHAHKARLESLETPQWLGNLATHCTMSKLQNIPSNVQYRCISRTRPNMSQSKLKRLIQRGSISSDEVKHYRTKMFASGVDNPYLELESSSNGHKYRRYLQFSELLNKPQQGSFDSFGLSKEATIPWF